MPTVDQQKAASRKLSHWIENEKRVVTYRDVSREFGCHVNVAKNILLVHLNSNASLNATYLLTGPLLRTSTLTQTVLKDHDGSSGQASQSLLHMGGTQKIRIVDMDEMSEGDRNSEDENDMLDEEGMEGVGNDKGALGEVAYGPGGGGSRLVGDGIAGRSRLGVGGDGGGGREDEVLRSEEVRRWGVVLVSQEKLEEKKKLFEHDTLNIHVYALAPGPVNDPAQYLVSSLTLRDHAKYRDSATYGTIRGATAGSGTASGSGTTAAMRDGAMDWGKKKAEVKKVEPKKVEPKEVEPKEVEPKKIENKVEAEAKKVEAKQAALPPAASTSAPEAAVATTSKSASTKTSQSQSQSQSRKKRVVASDTESDGDVAPEKLASSTSNSTTKKGGGGGKGEAAVEPTSSMVRADDKAAMEAMMSMDLDVDLSDGDGGGEDVKPDVTQLKRSQSKKGRSSAGGGAATTTAGGRKRRKVKKSETVMDAKGYMVTKDHWSDESYSGESDQEPQSKASTTQAQGKAKTTTNKPPLKGRESTASLGSSSAKEDKKPSGSFGGGSGGKVGTGAGGAAAGGKGMGKPATGQSTLKGFFTKK